MVSLYNTPTRRKEEFRPLKPPFVGMYTCGVTVYDHTTLGHMRTYTNTDFLRRTLEYNGFKVKHIENVTDVGHLTSDADTGEDRLEKRAKERKESVWELAERYTKEFFETADALNIQRPHIICKATDHIKEMIDLVKRLEEKGFTYIIPGDGVYFDTSKLPDYGKLARLDIEGLKAGARVEMAPGKKNITDFVLWKFTPRGEERQMEWGSPWAKKSFPGWHIECSAMSMKYLGETFDLHTGGVDHIPVHHTNEIAQSEAATGKPFVKHWFHNEFLMIEGRKMSKSLGNFYWMKDVREKGFDPLALRYLFLTAHYRSRMNFTWEGLEAAQTALNKLRKATAELVPAGNVAVAPRPAQEKLRERFLTAVNDDLNLPQALAVVWGMIKEQSTRGNQQGTILYQTLLDFDRVLGLGLSEVSAPKPSKIPQEVLELVGERERLRREGQFKKADEVRAKVEKLDFKIVDTAAGPRISQTRSQQTRSSSVPKA